MRIVILTNADIGLYKFRKELIEQFCKEHEVYIILPDGEFIEPLKKLGCKFVPLEFNRRGTNPIADLGQVKRYVRLLKKLKPNIVLTYTIKPNVYGGIACQITKSPYIANVTGLGTTIENGGLLSFISMTLYKIGLRGAGCVFFQNKNNELLFVDKKIVKGKARLIPGSGVNLQTHYVEPYPSDQDDIRFLFVGRIMKDKGIGELLEAIHQIHKENHNVVLDIVGWSDEDYSEALKKAEQEGAVCYHGLQSDVHPFYARCHCVVLPSYHEGTANVILEASSTGRPVITTHVPGCQETFDEGITGFGCEAKSSKSLAEAMKKFLAVPQERRARMGMAARAKMEKEYDRNLVLKAYQEEIEANSSCGKGICKPGKICYNKRL
ncbi:MAG: glycosyltransferase family 4 protein [Lachnospiraceae bacterium]